MKAWLWTDKKWEINLKHASCQDASQTYFLQGFWKMFDPHKPRKDFSVRNEKCFKYRSLQTWKWTRGEKNNLFFSLSQMLSKGANDRYWGSNREVMWFQVYLMGYVLVVNSKEKNAWFTSNPDFWSDTGPLRLVLKCAVLDILLSYFHIQY